MTRPDGAPRLPTMETFILDRRPDLLPQIEPLSRQSWPEFLLHGDVRGWRTLFSTFAPWQVLLCEAAPPGREVVAVAHTVPIVWNGEPADLPETITGIIDRGNETQVRDALASASRASGRRATASRPTTLAAVAAMVRPDRRGRGLSTAVLRAMLDLARRRGLSSLVAPVRPSRKAEDPLASMEEYLRRRRSDGSPFDPWVRVHVRLGGKILGIAERTLSVDGSVAEWEEWTGMRFPDTGEYIVPGALRPVTIDRERDRGRYEDPNVWMVHRLGPRR